MNYTDLVKYAANLVQAEADAKGLDAEHVYGSSKRAGGYTEVRAAIIVSLRQTVLQRKTDSGIEYGLGPMIADGDRGWRPLSILRIGALLRINHAAVHHQLGAAGVSYGELKLRP